MIVNRNAIFLLNVLQAALLRIVLVLTAAQTFGATHYANLNNPSPAAPYFTWDTAATNIQDAVDASAGGDQILVSNGVYNVGGRVVYGSMSNRVAVTKPVTGQSGHGAASTI